jgi:hypothetical protein
VLRLARRSGRLTPRRAVERAVVIRAAGARHESLCAPSLIPGALRCAGRPVPPARPPVARPTPRPVARW